MLLECYFKVNIPMKLFLCVRLMKILLFPLSLWNYQVYYYYVTVLIICLFLLTTTIMFEKNTYKNYIRNKVHNKS